MKLAEINWQKIIDKFKKWFVFICLFNEIVLFDKMFQNIIYVVINLIVVKMWQMDSTSENLKKKRILFQFYLNKNIFRIIAEG